MAKQESLYGRFAKYYDRLYARKKDYGKEAEFIDSLIRKYNPKAKSILDVACGTGTHMALLRKKGYSVMGVDASGAMLAIARKKMGNIRLIEADMRTFKLGQKFDVVMCMFSTINYLLTYGDLKRAFVNFYNHIAKNGLAIVDVGFFPQMLIPNHLFMDSYSRNGLKIARLAKSEMRKDGLLDVSMLFLVKNRGKMDFEVDEHQLMPINLVRLKKTMRSAGFSGIKVFDGYSMRSFNQKSQRAVFVGVKTK